MEHRQYQAAGGVVVQRGLIAGLSPERDYILLLDRPSRNEVRLPKGHIEEDERAGEAALRETVEESGYADLEILSDLGDQVVAFDYDGAHYVRHERYFLMRLRSAHCVQRNQADAEQFVIRWVPVEEAEDELTYETEQQWVQRAVTKLKALARRENLMHE